MEIRQLTEDDIPSVLVVQHEAYLPQLLESSGTFLNKLQLFPQGALGCFIEGHLCAYIFFHPWVRNKVVPLNCSIDHLPSNTDCIYIHDLAVSPSCRAKGIGHKLVEEVLQLGSKLGIRWYSLIAVQSSEHFWQRFGFQPISQLEYADDIQGTKMLLERLPNEIHR